MVKMEKIDTNGELECFTLKSSTLRNGDNNFFGFTISKTFNTNIFPVATSTLSIYKVLCNKPKEAKDKEHIQMISPTLK